MLRVYYGNVLMVSFEIVSEQTNLEDHKKILKTRALSTIMSDYLCCCLGTRRKELNFCDDGVTELGLG